MDQDMCHDQQYDQASGTHSSQLVTFVDTPSNYTPSRDIFVEYRQKRKLTSHADDWVGVFLSDWFTLDECIAQQAVPKPTKRNKKITRKVIKIPANTIKVDADFDGLYQLAYVTKDGRVVGMSEFFTLREQPMITDHYVSELGPFELLDEDQHKAQTGAYMFDSFFVVDEMKKEILDAMKTPQSDDVNDDETVSVNDVTLISELTVECEAPKAVDHVTLASDFTVTPSGTTMHNHVDFIIEMEPVMQQYLDNQERSLLPVYPEQWALLPYEPFNPLHPPVITCAQDHSKENNMLEALSNILSDAPTPPDTHIIPTANTPKRAGASSCRNCNRRTTEVKLSKRKLKRARLDRNKLRDEISHHKDYIQEQEMLLNEFAAQIKNLVHDKAQLTVINEDMSAEVEKLAEQMQRQRRRISEMKKTFKQQQKTNRELEDSILDLEGQSSSYELVIRMTDTEREFQQQRNEFLESEMSDLLVRYKASESLLDDIMYTLSIHGYRKMVDIHGKMVDLSKKHGNIMELYGWSMERNKRDELHMINLAKQEERVQNLRNDLITSNTELQLKTNQVEQLQQQLHHQDDKNHQLIQKVEHLMYCMALAEEKEGALYNMLLQERKKHCLYQLQQHSEVQKLENKTVQTKMTFSGQKPDCLVDHQYLAPSTKNKSAVTFSMPQGVDMSSGNKKQNAFSSDTRLFKRYSDAVKYASEKSIRSSANCDSEFEKAWKRQHEESLTVTQSAPPVTDGCQIPPKVIRNQSRQQQEVHATESAPPKLENDNDQYLPEPGDSGILCGNVLGQLFNEPKSDVAMRQSVILEGGVLPTMYREPRDELSGQESSIFEGNILKNLFRKTTSRQTAARQESIVFEEDVLPNLFDDSAAGKPEISDMESNIFQFGVLNNLSVEDKSDEHLASPGSSVLDGEILPNLFRQSDSNDSIETLDYSESDVYLDQECAAFDLPSCQNAPNPPISLEEFTRMLDSALAILFQHATDNKDEPIAPLHPSVRSALDSVRGIESDEEVIPLLGEFTLSDMFSNLKTKSEYEIIPDEEPFATTSEVPNESQLDINHVEDQTSPFITKSTRLTRGQRKQGKFAFTPMCNSKRRKNRKNYKHSNYGASNSRQ